MKVQVFGHVPPLDLMNLAPHTSLIRGCPFEAHYHKQKFVVPPPKNISILTSFPSTSILLFFMMQFISLMTLPKDVFSVSYFSGPFTIHSVLFPLKDITLSPVCKREKDKIIKLVVRDILAPSPLILTFIGSSSGWSGCH